MSDIPTPLRERVVQRAGNRCEYCGLSGLGGEKVPGTVLKDPAPRPASIPAKGFGTHYSGPAEEKRCVMLDYYRAKMRTIEDLFGRPFLEKKSDHLLRPSGRGQHPIRFHYAMSRNLLRNPGSREHPFLNESLAYISAIATAIEQTHGLPGFDSEIRDSLKRWDEFENTAYEMRIGAMCAEMGEAEFILRQPKLRTPDVKVTRNGVTVLVECRRKQRLISSSIHLDSQNRLSEAVQGLAKERASGYDILIVILGTAQSAIDVSLEGAAHLVTNRTPGIIYHEKQGVWVSVQDGVPPPPFPTEPGKVGLWLNAGMTCGRSSMLVKLDEQGNVEIGQSSRIQVVALDSHRFSTVLSSFNDKRQHGQLYGVHPGVVAIDLDLAHLHPDHRLLYLNIVGRMMLRRAWFQGSNSSIAGILLTAWPAWCELEYDGNRHLVDALLTCRVTPGGSAIPDWFCANKMALEKHEGATQA